jgi:hypothetical protein
VKAATGEVISATDLGGAEVHAAARAWSTTWPPTTSMPCRSCAGSSAT